MGTATITEWNPVTWKAVDDSGGVTVDFDPASLQLTYTPTGVTGANAVISSGTWSKFAAQQTGQSTTLSVDLTFDTTATGKSVADRTQPIVALTLPAVSRGSAAPARRVARFSWGGFVFYGAVQTLTQTIDFFSAAGIPLRASVRMTLSDVKQPDPATAQPPQATPVPFGAAAGTGAAPATAAAPSAVTAATGAPVGTTPLTLSQAGDSVQSIAARSGAGVPWKTIAAANGIDNPRLLPPGTVLDPSVRTP
ncbi:LysM peptidoglycan-binding domain-containing protein [Streptomyces sp. NPDC048277]|uniref:CIS tube protein n=1 Tax=Streptomyces sp. NPDC048277 TaxID=3155027 RepID=UPI0033D3A328